MRSYDPNDKYDVEELEKLNAEPWMVECLSLNLSYTSWGPGEDDMPTERVIFNSTWEDFGPWNLDELNECVNFYFKLERASRECEPCDKSGYNPETHQISEDFYDFPGTGWRWVDKITQDEVDVLVKAGRLNVRKPTEKVLAETVNAANSGRRSFSHDLCHDAINRSILIEARARRLGVWGKCVHCQGAGYGYVEPSAKLALVLWMLQPRKGLSRGVAVAEIKQEELPVVTAWLGTAAKRNAKRFARVSKYAVKEFALQQIAGKS